MHALSHRFVYRLRIRRRCRSRRLLLLGFRSRRFFSLAFLDRFFNHTTHSTIFTRIA